MGIKRKKLIRLIVLFCAVLACSSVLYGKRETIAGIVKENIGAESGSDAKTKKEKEPRSTDWKSRAAEIEVSNDEDDYPWLNSNPEKVTIGVYDYELKYPVDTYLVIGTDGGGNEDGIGDEYLGDCGDFLALLVVDDKKETYYVVEINRDTMAYVPLMDIYGRADEVNYMQICMAHCYGGNRDMSAKNMSDAVSELLGGIEIDGYISIPVTCIGEINHAVGGVTVTITDDFSKEDPTLVMGETVKLNDTQAEHFVRGRMSVADGTNENRMKRQKEYLEAYYARMRELSKSDTTFATNFFGLIKSMSTSNVGLDEMSAEFLRVKNYTDGGRYEIEGYADENATFGDGEEHAEFYADEESIASVLEEILPLTQIIPGEVGE